MDKKEELIKAFSDLLDYIENNLVFDKISDSGCGYIDPHRSDQFQYFIERAKRAIQEVKG